jgi:hypothetical protein
VVGAYANPPKKPKSPLKNGKVIAITIVKAGKFDWFTNQPQYSWYNFFMPQNDVDETQDLNLKLDFAKGVF